MKILMGRKKGVEQDRWESMLWHHSRGPDNHRH